MKILVILVLIFAFLYLRERPEARGRKSEKELIRKLKGSIFVKSQGARILSNLYVKKETGDTTEIDVLMISPKGIFVLENKDYKGYIFGSESEPKWTKTTFKGRTRYGRNRVGKYQFPNPIWQNRNHIKNLQAYLGNGVRMYSIVTFSDRGSIKSVSIRSSDVSVCNHAQLLDVVSGIWMSNPDNLTQSQIEEIYQKLVPLTIATHAKKEKHVEAIQERFGSVEVCPVCGGEMVVTPFGFGCSNYRKSVFRLQ